MTKQFNYVTNYLEMILLFFNTCKLKRKLRKGKAESETINIMVKIQRFGIVKVRR